MCKISPDLCLPLTRPLPQTPTTRTHTAITAERILLEKKYVVAAQRHRNASHSTPFPHDRGGRKSRGGARSGTDMRVTGSDMPGNLQSATTGAGAGAGTGTGPNTSLGMGMSTYTDERYGLEETPPDLAICRSSFHAYMRQLSCPSDIYRGPKHATASTTGATTVRPETGTFSNRLRCEHGCYAMLCFALLCCALFCFSLQ